MLLKDFRCHYWIKSSFRNPLKPGDTARLYLRFIMSSNTLEKTLLTNDLYLLTLDEYGGKIKVDELYDEEEKRIVKLTWNLYKNIDAKKLIELTHKKGTPWDLTYMPQENKIIDNALIKRYYKKFMKNLKKEQMSSRKSSDNRNKRTLSFRGSRIII